jgi:hypothetical protein
MKVPSFALLILIRSLSLHPALDALLVVDPPYPQYTTGNLQCLITLDSDSLVSYLGKAYLLVIISVIRFTRLELPLIEFELCLTTEQIREWE